MLMVFSVNRGMVCSIFGGVGMLFLSSCDGNLMDFFVLSLRLEVFWSRGFSHV